MEEACSGDFRPTRDKLKVAAEKALPPLKSTFRAVCFAFPGARATRPRSESFHPPANLPPWCNFLVRTRSPAVFTQPRSHRSRFRGLFGLVCHRVDKDICSELERILILEAIAVRVWELLPAVPKIKSAVHDGQPSVDCDPF